MQTLNQIELHSIHGGLSMPQCATACFTALKEMATPSMPEIVSAHPYLAIAATLSALTLGYFGYKKLS